MSTKNEMLVQLQNLRKQRGQGYFIMPNCTTSRKITGARDYWQYAYQVYYVKPNGELDVDFCSSMKELTKSLRKHPTKSIVALELMAEHVASKCGSYRAPYGPDVHCHEVSLGIICGNQYTQYEDQL